MASTHVLIIGAGVCGLAIANGLQKAGIAFTIFDSEEETAYRPREWTMALHWSIPMLKELLPNHLADRLNVDAVVDASLDYTKHPNNVLPIFDGTTGETMAEVPTGGIRVSRRKLRTLCMEHLDIQFDHKLQSIEYDDDSVTATFSNGEKCIGTLLVGADGSRSAVRQHMFPGHANSTAMDLMYTNVAFRYPDAEKALFVRGASPITALVVHPESSALISLQDATDTQRPETWVFQLIISWKGARTPNASSEAMHAQVKERGAKLSEPFRSAFLWIPDDVELRPYELGYWIPPTQPWPSHDGRVTLAGDAAHPMPPYRGQGLNHAINDAYNFVTAVKRSDEGNQAQVVHEYSAEIAERGGKEVQLSLAVAAETLDYTEFRQSALVKQGLSKGS